MGSVWLSLLKPIVEATGNPVARLTIGVLEALVASSDAQIDSLRRTERKIDDLLQGPLLTGLEWFDSAERPHRTYAQRRMDYERAKEKFVEAQAQLQGLTRAISQTYVAITYGISGHDLDRKLWFDRAKDTADAEILDAVLRAAQTKDRLIDRHAAKRLAIEDAIHTLILGSPLIEQICSTSATPRIVCELHVHYQFEATYDRINFPVGRYAILIFKRDDHVWQFDVDQVLDPPLPLPETGEVELQLYPPNESGMCVPFVVSQDSTSFLPPVSFAGIVEDMIGDAPRR